MLDVALATPAAALFDVVRVTSFIVLGRTGRAWRGRPLPLAITAILLPIGFLMILFGSSLGTVLVGELVFGAASGFAYTAALSYAMVVKNASVDAGGKHEGLIGLGLGLGPLAGIVGYGLAGHQPRSFGRRARLPPRNAARGAAASLRLRDRRASSDASASARALVRRRRTAPRRPCVI